MKYTHEELNKRCEKYFEELTKKGIDPDEIQDLCVIFLENGGRKYVPKWYSKKKALEEDFEKELVPFAEDNRDAIYYIDPISYADDLYERLYNILITLTKRETSVLYYRFGENLTLDQTKKIFNVTRERIRQVEAKALRKIRHPWRSRNIRDFVDAYNSGTFYNIYIDKPESISGSNDFLKIFKEACNYLTENKSVDVLTEPVKKKPLARNVDTSNLSLEEIAIVWDEYRNVLLSNPDAVVTKPKKTIAEKISAKRIKDDAISENIRKIKYICNKYSVRSNAHIHTEYMKYMSNLFMYIKMDSCTALKNKETECRLKFSKSLLRETKELSEKYNINISAICEHIAEYYPWSEKWFITALYAMDFEWARYNTALLPAPLSEAIYEITRYHNALRYYHIPFIEVLKEYDKIAGTKTTENVLVEMEKFIDNNKCKGIVQDIIEEYPQYEKSPFIFVSEDDRKHSALDGRDIDNNWKREFKISKSIYDGNLTRAERFKTKIKYSASERKKSIADRRREVGLSILKRIKNHEYDPPNFCSILSEAYKLIYGSQGSMRIYHSLQTMKDYNYNAFENIEKYIDFVNSNTDWVLTIISNMVKRRIIDIKYNTIDFSRSCNLIDKYMETRSIESVIDGTIYRNIEDYDEFGCKLPQLDHHYVALFDIVYMLKACCEYKRF